MANRLKLRTIFTSSLCIVVQTSQVSVRCQCDRPRNDPSPPLFLRHFIPVGLRSNVAIHTRYPLDPT